MSGEFLQSQSEQQASGPDSGLSGVMIGQVIGNCDVKRLGRVHIRLAARGGIEIWARIALLDPGAYFMPQDGDEVLVAFHQGDGNEAYVIGNLWNEIKRPPRQGEADPKTLRGISTPSGHEITFDEKQQSMEIKTSTGQHISLKPGGIEIGVDEQGKALITLDSAGNLKIEAITNITLKAPVIKLDARDLTLGDATSASIKIG
ncbi:MAG: phage baseplate assembly protein V [Nitrosomonas sp.]|jgi:uncharacterized protein involved in type VI secretion and phage assembly|uniref:phage baseplate assembly protein V n=1 Tax=Nitrosomonas sp. TaxID=42353 RepID=UPI001E116CB2|nr:phage baseplate assembly protein V [Nitrosomonas sp.]MBX9895604.1 phage baseplate assembly protein V [Nitrosomonas sp.]